MCFKLLLTTHPIPSRRYEFSVGEDGLSYAFKAKGTLLSCGQATSNTSTETEVSGAGSTYYYLQYDFLRLSSTSHVSYVVSQTARVSLDAPNIRIRSTSSKLQPHPAVRYRLLLPPALFYVLVAQPL